MDMSVERVNAMANNKLSPNPLNIAQNARVFVLHTGVSFRYFFKV